MDIQTVPIKAINDIPQWGCVTASGELADSGNPAHQGHVVGITDGKIASGVWGAVCVAGTVFFISWTWTPGAAIYLNTTVLSQTPPGVGFVQVVGWALSKQTMLVNF